METNEWVSVEYSMPAVGKKVEIKFNFGFNKEEIKSGIFGYSSTRDSFIFYDPTNNDYFNIKYITHWRYRQEKHPDFCRLNFRDYIVIDFSLNKITFEKYSGWFSEIKEDFLYLSGRDSLFIDVYAVDLKYIKKITRINLEEKTFEEI